MAELTQPATVLSVTDLTPMFANSSSFLKHRRFRFSPVSGFR